MISYTADRISAISDPLTRVVRYSYDGTGRLETVTDPAGGVTRYSYDATAGGIRSIVDARGITYLRTEYDAKGRVIKEHQADGGTWSFTYLGPEDAPTGAVAVNPRGHTTTYRWDPQGFLREVTDALGQAKTFERDPATSLLLAVKGNATCTACGNQSAGDQSFTYDAKGNVLTRTDALGQTTTFMYESAFNRVASIKDPLGNITKFTYDARGNLSKRTDENNHTTSFGYDSAGLLTEIIDPLSQRTMFAYDALSNLISITDPLNHITLFRYDAISRQVETIDTLTRKTGTTYDNLDQVVAQTNAKNDANEICL